ncbi:MAG: hypothetical protein NUW01_13045, partial [Gemmatimonadaceae bacterium]|nr:hypothetical protein [Gemmatimonadaceae bacterium]
MGPFEPYDLGFEQRGQQAPVLWQPEPEQYDPRGIAFQADQRSTENPFLSGLTDFASQMWDVQREQAAVNAGLSSTMPSSYGTGPSSEVTSRNLEALDMLGGSGNKFLSGVTPLDYETLEGLPYGLNYVTNALTPLNIAMAGAPASTPLFGSLFKGPYLKNLAAEIGIDIGARALGEQAGGDLGASIPLFGEQPPWLRGLEGGLIGGLGTAGAFKGLDAGIPALGRYAGEPIEVAPGQFVKRGEFGGGKFGPVPEEVPPGWTKIGPNEWSAGNALLKREPNGWVMQVEEFDTRFGTKTFDPEQGPKPLATFKGKTLDDVYAKVDAANKAKEEAWVGSEVARRFPEEEPPLSSFVEPPKLTADAGPVMDTAKLFESREGITGRGIPEGRGALGSGPVRPQTNLFGEVAQQPVFRGDESPAILQARKSALDTLASNREIRRSGVTAAEVASGRRAQAGGILSGYESAIAEGKTGAELLDAAVDNIPGGRIIQTNAGAIAPGERDALKDVIVQWLQEEPATRAFQARTARDVVEAMSSPQGYMPQPAEDLLLRRILGDELTDTISSRHAGFNVEGAKVETPTRPLALGEQTAPVQPPISALDEGKYVTPERRAQDFADALEAKRQQAEEFMARLRAGG